MEKQVRDLQLVIVKLRGKRTTTTNIVGLTMLGVVPSVLAVVCKRMQQLPTVLRPAVHHGKDTTHKTLETMGYARAWPQQCWKELGKRIQHCCATLRRSRNKRNVGSCWLKRLTGFKLCATTCIRVYKQTQYVTSNSVGSCWPTMLRLVGLFSRFPDFVSDLLFSANILLL